MYVSGIFGVGILLAQWAVIICIYSRMRRQYRQNKDFGGSNGRKMSLPYNESEDVQMLGITSTRVDSSGWRFSEYSDASSVPDDQVFYQLLYCVCLSCFFTS